MTPILLVAIVVVALAALQLSGLLALGSARRIDREVADIHRRQLALAHLGSASARARATRGPGDHR